MQGSAKVYLLSDLTSKTLHGVKWSYLATVANIVLQLGLSAVLARLLEPSAFGTVAMALVVLQFGNFFAQLGVGRALIQKPDLSDEEIRAGFTSSVGLGVVMAVLTYLTAPWVGTYYQNPEVVPVLRVLGLSYVFTGLAVTSMSLLRRNFAFRLDGLTEVASYLVGYGLVGVPLALTGWGVWSLVFASLAQGLLAAVIYYGAARHSLKPIFVWRAYQPLYSFGSRVSLIGIFEFIGYNLDTLLIGRLTSASALGLYNRAYLLARLPLYKFATSVSKVLFPSFSQLQLEPKRLGNAYLLTISLAGAFIFPIAFGMSAASRELISVLLGAQWTEAIPVLQILALAMPASLLTHFSGIACEALAVLKEKLILQVSYVAVLALLFWLAQGYGLVGFATALGVAELVRHLAYIVLTRRVLGLSTRAIFQAYAPPLLSGIITGAAIYGVAFLGHTLELPLLLVLGAEVVAGACCLLLAFAFGPLKAIGSAALGKFLPKHAALRRHDLVKRYLGA